MTIPPRDTAAMGEGQGEYRLQGQGQGWCIVDSQVGSNLNGIGDTGGSVQNYCGKDRCDWQLRK